MLKRAVPLACALVLAATDASAQMLQFSYVLGGWTMEDRPGPTRGGQRTVMPHGFSAGLGLRLKDGFDLEISGGLTGKSSQTWFFSYLFGTNGDKLTTERDVPVIVSIRYSQGCFRRICTDVLIGGGFSMHVVNTTALTECPRATPGPCVPVNRTEGEADHLEPLFAGGLDFKILLNDRVSIAPGLRLRFTGRGDYLTDYVFRGPGQVDTANLSVGVTGIVRLR